MVITFVSRFASGGVLDAPWGLAVAPTGFGDLGGDVLIANNGDGTINAFTPSGIYVGTLDGTNGSPLAFQDLWAIDFRTGERTSIPMHSTSPKVSITTRAVSLEQLLLRRNLRVSGWSDRRFSRSGCSPGAA